MTEIARQAVIRGRVQGVGYRYWTCAAAERLGLSGWVRNRPDGTVELLAHGPPDRVEALLRDCRDGPPAAAVSAVEARPAEPPARMPDGGPLAGFRQV